MKRLLLPAWILLGLEVLFVVMLTVTKNVGDDAAGRGMASGFAMLLAPLVLLTGGLLFWAQRGGPAVALWVGILLAFSPALIWAAIAGGNAVTSMSQAKGRAEFGKFDDPRLTSLARAIEKVDAARMRVILGQGSVDWHARDRRGQTVLGHAISLAGDEYVDTMRVVPVRLLLDAGAPVESNVIAAARTPESISAHDVVYHLYFLGTTNALVVLDLLLARGLSPNAVDEDGRPIHVTPHTTPAALEVLARHGADFTRLGTKPDQLGWTGLMHAVSRRRWAEATFFLEHGISPGYVAPDGTSVRSILAEVDPPGTEYYGDDIARHAAFVAALERHPAWR